jgi:hypothetical protein
VISNGSGSSSLGWSTNRSIAASMSSKRSGCRSNGLPLGALVLGGSALDGSAWTAVPGLLRSLNTNRARPAVRPPPPSAPLRSERLPAKLCRRCPCPGSAPRNRGSARATGDRVASGRRGQYGAGSQARPFPPRGRGPISAPRSRSNGEGRRRGLPCPLAMRPARPGNDGLDVAMTSKTSRSMPSTKTFRVPSTPGPSRTSMTPDVRAGCRPGPSPVPPKRAHARPTLAPSSGASALPTWHWPMSCGAGWTRATRRASATGTNGARVASETSEANFSSPTMATGVSMSAKARGRRPRRPPRRRAPRGPVRGRDGPGPVAATGNNAAKHGLRAPKNRSKQLLETHYGLR